MTDDLKAACREQLMREFVATLPTDLNERMRAIRAAAALAAEVAAAAVLAPPARPHDQ